MQHSLPRPDSPHDGLSGAVSLIELLVPVGQKSVALANRVTDQRHVLRTKQPGLAARGVQVGVSPEEWLIGSGLVPAHQQLRARGLEEATNISCEDGGGEC